MSAVDLETGTYKAQVTLHATQSECAAVAVIEEYNLCIG